jgi:hypothetical protein
VESADTVTVLYVIQVMARHGVGSQGWRTVRRPSGEPYCFQTHDAALAALRQHFPALREDHDVRVQALAAPLESQPTPALPQDPTVRTVPPPQPPPDKARQ